MNFFTVLNKKTGETITPAYINEKGQVLDYEEGEIGLRTDQNNLEIYFFNGTCLSVKEISSLIQRLNGANNE